MCCLKQKRSLRLINQNSTESMEQSEALIYAITEICEGGSYTPTHKHSDKHQLIFAKNRTIKIQTENNYWILPPARAIWIERGITHNFYSKYSVEVYILYIRQDIAQHISYTNCCVFNISPLVHQLVQACLNFSNDYKDDSPQGRLSYVLLEQLQQLDQSPVSIPMPDNIILQKICNKFEHEPSMQVTLPELSVWAGASARTIERLFLKEMGLSYSEWRFRFRLIKSLEYLAEGYPITHAAYNVGYNHVSSYIAAFKKFFGCTPKQYFNFSFSSEA